MLASEFWINVDIKGEQEAIPQAQGCQIACCFTAWINSPSREGRRMSICQLEVAACLNCGSPLTDSSKLKDFCSYSCRGQHSVKALDGALSTGVPT